MPLMPPHWMPCQRKGLDHDFTFFSLNLVVPGFLSRLGLLLISLSIRAPCLTLIPCHAMPCNIMLEAGTTAHMYVCRHHCRPHYSVLEVMYVWMDGWMYCVMVPWCAKEHRNQLEVIEHTQGPGYVARVQVSRDYYILYVCSRVQPFSAYAEDFICMYICIYVCMHVCMYVCIYVHGIVMGGIAKMQYACTVLRTRA